MKTTDLIACMCARVLERVYGKVNVYIQIEAEPNTLPRPYARLKKFYKQQLTASECCGGGKLVHPHEQLHGTQLAASCKGLRRAKKKVNQEVCRTVANGDNDHYDAAG